MGEKRREDRTPGPTKFQVLATEGVPTFLLLEAAAARNHRPVHPDAEGERLGVLAEEIEGRLPPPERRPWPGGVAVTLGELAVRDFFPRAAAPPNAVVPNGGLYRTLADGRYVRAVNFHATPLRLAGRLEEQLSRLAESFVPVSYDDLVGLMRTGDWPHERPGVVLNFFDGFRDNFEVAAPILDRLSLVGWFFVVSDWVTTPPGEQRSFATHHLIDLPYDDGTCPPTAGSPSRPTRSVPCRNEDTSSPPTRALTRLPAQSLYRTPRPQRWNKRWRSPNATSNASPGYRSALSRGVRELL